MSVESQAPVRSTLQTSVSSRSVGFSSVAVNKRRSASCIRAGCSFDHWSISFGTSVPSGPNYTAADDGVNADRFPERGRVRRGGGDGPEVYLLVLALSLCAVNMCVGFELIFARNGLSANGFDNSVAVGWVLTLPRHSIQNSKNSPNLARFGVMKGLAERVGFELSRLLWILQVADSTMPGFP